MPFMPTLGRQRQDDMCELKPSLLYIVSSKTAGLHRKILSHETNKKMANKPKKVYFSIEAAQETNKYVAKCSTSLIINKNQSCNRLLLHTTKNG